MFISERTEEKAAWTKFFFIMNKKSNHTLPRIPMIVHGSENRPGDIAELVECLSSIEKDLGSIAHSTLNRFEGASL